MKSMNVKKLAALAVGALFAGQAYAAGLVANTLPTDKSWYTHSAIVIGAKAKPADVVWAGNIAAAIGQMAFEAKTETKTVDLKDAKVKLSVPGEIAVGGVGKMVDNIAFKIGEVDIPSSQEIVATSDDVPSLMTAKEFKFQKKVNGDWEDKSYYETTKIVLSNVNVENYEDKLVATVSGYPMFRTEISGAVFDENVGGTITYTDGTDFKNLYVDLAGKDYKITKVTINNSTSPTKVSVELATSTGEVTAYKGDTVDLGDGYSLKLIDIDKDNGKALVEIMGPNGLDFTDTLTSSPTDFDGKLPFKISLKDYFAGTDTVYAKIGLKSETITFDNIDISSGSGTAEVDFGKSGSGWKLKIYVSENGTDHTVSIDRLELYYVGDDNGTYTSLDKGWEPGTTIWFPGEKYGVTFAGFTAKPMKKGEIGYDITAIDPSGKVYTTKLTFSRVSMSEPTSGKSEYTIGNFINDKTLNIAVYSDGKIGIDTDFRTDNGYEINLDPTSTGTDTKVIGFNFDDDNAADVYFKVTATKSGEIENVYLDYAGDGYQPQGSTGVTLNDGDTINVTIGSIKNGTLAVSFTDGADSDDVSLTVGGTTILSNQGSGTPNVEFYVYDKDGSLVVTTTDPGVPAIKFTGTADINDNGNNADESLQITSATPVHFIDTDMGSVFAVFYNDIANDDTHQYDYYVVEEPDGATITVPVKTKETSTGSGIYILDKVDLKDEDATWSDGTHSYTIDADPESGEPDFMYTEWGSEVKAYSDKLDLEVPTEQRYLKFFLGEPSKTVEVNGYIEVPVGGETEIAGTPIKVEGIEANNLSVTYTTYEPMKDWSPEIVYLDSDSDWQTYDKVIVVGGYLVNNVAKMLADEYNELYDIKEAGDWIVKKYDYQGKEYIVVFGYTADDTGTAAHEFINWLRENAQ